MDCSSSQEVGDPPAKRSRRVQLANARVSETSISDKCDSMVVSGEEERPIKTSKRWEAWNDEVVNHFFEGLKMYGKDFEAITKHIRTKSKGECPKNHDQVRSHFYNTLSKVSSFIDLCDVSVPKEARELFPLINYMEWVKRTKLAIRNNERRKENFRELVFKGSVFVKVKTGKGNKSNKTMIKTPICPALRKYCEEVRDQSPRCPAEITVELLPSTYCDKAYVLECEQNPLIRLHLNSPDSIAQYLNCIANKWLPPDIRKRQCRLKEDISEWIPEISLFAEKSSKLSCVQLLASANSNSSLTCISMDRCIQLNLEKGDTTKKCTSNTEPITRQASHNDKVLEEGNPVISGIFERVNVEEQKLDPSLLRDGLTQENVGSLTAGQLSLMFEGADHIRLLYSVKSKYRESNPQAWQCLMTLLLRDYGEAVHKATGNDPNTRTDSAAMPPPRLPRPISIPAQKAPVRGEAVRMENNHFFEQLKHLHSPSPSSGLPNQNPSKFVLKQVISTRPHFIQGVVSAPNPPQTAPTPPPSAVLSMQVDPDANIDSVLSSGHLVLTPNGSRVKESAKKLDKVVVSSEPKRQLDFNSIVSNESNDAHSLASFSAFFGSPSKQPSFSNPVPLEVGAKMMEVINCDTNDFFENNNLDNLCSNSNLSQPIENSNLDTPRKSSG